MATPMEDLWDRQRTARFFGVKPAVIDAWCRKGILPFEVHPCGRRWDPVAIAAYRAPRKFGPSVPSDSHANDHRSQDSRGAA